jgi:hypothetical protein
VRERERGRTATCSSASFPLTSFSDGGNILHLCQTPPCSSSPPRNTRYRLLSSRNRAEPHPYRYCTVRAYPTRHRLRAPLKMPATPQRAHSIRSHCLKDIPPDPAQTSDLPDRQACASYAASRFTRAHLPAQPALALPVAQSWRFRFGAPSCALANGFSRTRIPCFSFTAAAIFGRSQV